ncbi:TPA: prepilin-type N-terminal cleavage/methylation domain-containing protein [Vibrio diabolicus]|uniref:pilin n=1 Tax=Vibrio TaxID=662 RepID=UPI0006B26677|nr:MULTISPECIES: pilin [Vibrio]KOY43545.1 fimbrial protein [Vibrio parahaemolyticus]MCR9495022.1 pilin [Vibrio alginolyticus]MCQ9246704.1 pilin [Vibrio diabolicus]MCR9551029.1 pilin [Vibrio sp. RM-41-2A]MCR9556894.1 pilin [Vibrio sp. RM-41-2B]
MKNSKQKKQQGFTLIELMIVVGIIGILSALAIPAYQSYVLKTEANTAVSVPRALTTNIDMYIQEKGVFPPNSDIGDVGGATDMSALGTLKLTPGTGEAGELEFEITNTEASLANKKITFARTSAGWKCTHDTGQNLKGCGAAVTP